MKFLQLWPEIPVINGILILLQLWLYIYIYILKGLRPLPPTLGLWRQASA